MLLTYLVSIFPEAKKRTFSRFDLIFCSESCLTQRFLVIEEKFSFYGFFVAVLTDLNVFYIKQNILPVINKIKNSMNNTVFVSKLA